MANICIELILRLGVEFWLFFLDRWFLVIFFGLIFYNIVKRLKTKGPVIIGVLATLLNLGTDFFLLATGGLAIVISIIVGIAIGFLWMGMSSFSVAPGIIRIINAPLMFLIGLGWGIAEAPIPVAVVVGGAMNWRISNYVMSLVPAIVITAFLWFVGPTACSVLNTGIKFFS